MAFGIYGSIDEVSMPLSQHESTVIYKRDASEDSPLRWKVIHDRVHDQISFHPALVAIMDTPQFQRLRDLRQLGNCHYVYPGATHTRFEHSLGVAHLAVKYLRQLKSNHELVPPRLEIDNRDELCIAMAGLCHDLGHGPFSHMFEEYVNHMRAKKGDDRKWQHEDASVDLFQHLLDVNDINLNQFGLNCEDVTFVKQLIVGLRPNAPWPSGNGRLPEKRFLFEIVCNKRNGLDVDKMDYFLRDSLSCYGKLPEFHVERMFNCSRVVDYEHESQICFEEKVALGLGDLFTLRAKLHKYVYQHRVVKVIDEMVKDALFASEDCFSISVGGKDYSLSDTVEKMEVFSLTGDWILSAIKASNNPLLRRSKEILEHIQYRHLYALVGYIILSEDFISAAELISFVPEAQRHPTLADSIFISVVKIVYGSSGDQPGDPINNVRFFNPKNSPNKAFELSSNRLSPLFSPREFLEVTIFVYCRDPDDLDVIQAAFKCWKAKHSHRVQEPVSFVNSSPAVSTAFKKRQRSSTPSQSPFQPRTANPDFS